MCIVVVVVVVSHIQRIGCQPEKKYFTWWPMCIYVCACVFMCVFMSICRYVCGCVAACVVGVGVGVFIKLHTTAQSGPVPLFNSHSMPLALVLRIGYQ